MKCPKYLTGEAAAFFKRHAARLESEGLLTPADYDSFLVLAEVVGERRAVYGSTDSKDRVYYMGLTKQYLALAKQFNLLPVARKKSGTEPVEDIGDVLGKLVGDA